MTGLLNAAPEAGGGMMSALASMASTFGGGVGEKMGGLGNLANLAGGFSN